MNAIAQESMADIAVVSMPCWELFDKQDAAYQEQVLGAGSVRIGVEAAVGFGWDRFIGSRGSFVGMRGFGASAPASELYKHFGITPAAIVDAAMMHIHRNRPLRTEPTKPAKS
jgi:transketolase